MRTAKEERLLKSNEREKVVMCGGGVCVWWVVGAQRTNSAHATSGTLFGVFEIGALAEGQETDLHFLCWLAVYTAYSFWE